MGERAINFSSSNRSASLTELETFAANIGDPDLQSRASELRALVESGDNFGPTPDQTLALNIQKKWEAVYGANIALWPTELRNELETISTGVGFASFNNNVISVLQNLSIREETYPAFEAGLAVITELALPDLAKQASQLQANANSGLIPAGATRAGLHFISSPATLVIPMWYAGLFGRATVGGVSAFGRFLGLANESAAALSVAASVPVEAAAFMGASNAVAELALPNSGRASSATTLDEFTASTIFFGGLKLFSWAGALAQSILPATELGALLARSAGHATSVLGLASMDRVQVAAGLTAAGSANFTEALWQALFLHATVQATNGVINVNGAKSNWAELARKAEEIGKQGLGNWPVPVFAGIACQPTITLPAGMQRAIQEAMEKRGGNMPNVFLIDGDGVKMDPRLRIDITKTPTKAVIFDNDGVVVNSEPILFEATARVFATHGITLLKEDVQDGIGAGSKYVQHPKDKYGLANATVEELMIAREKEFRELARNRLRSFPGFFALMELLKRKGIHTALASSATTDVVYYNLALAGIDAKLFDTIVDSSKIKNKKPFPDIFLAAAANLSLSPTQCLVIEDAPPGIEAAHRAGMRVVAVATSLPKSFLEHSNYVVDSIEDLTVLLDTLIGGSLHEKK